MRVRSYTVHVDVATHREDLEQNEIKKSQFGMIEDETRIE